MKQYLLSIYQPDGDPPPADVLAEIMRDVRAVDAGDALAGAWVFSGGLHAPSTATVVHPRRDEDADDRRARTWRARSTSAA